jgi:nucleotide-binding universal stress UspA family protein
MENREDKQIQKNMEAFEAALSSGKAAKEAASFRLKGILAAFDGSNQDEDVLGLSKTLASKVKIPLFLLPSTEKEGMDLGKTLETLTQEGIRVEGLLSEKEEAFRRILEALKARKPNLLVLPSPFGHDLGELGQTTLGTVVEVAISKGDCPTLVVRGSLSDPELYLSRPHLIIRDEVEADNKALAMAEILLQAFDRPELVLTFLRPKEVMTPEEWEELEEKGYDQAPENLLPLLEGGPSSLLHRLLSQNSLLKIRAGLLPEDGFAPALDETGGRLHILPFHLDQGVLPEFVHSFVLRTLDPVLVVGS